MASHSALFAIAVVVLLQGQTVFPLILDIFGTGRTGTGVSSRGGASGISGLFGSGSTGSVSVPRIGGLLFGSGSAGSGSVPYIGGLFGTGSAGSRTAGNGGAAGYSGSAGSGKASNGGAAGYGGSTGSGTAGNGGAAGYGGSAGSWTAGNGGAAGYGGSTGSGTAGNGGAAGYGGSTGSGTAGNGGAAGSGTAGKGGAAGYGGSAGSGTAGSSGSGAGGSVGSGDAAGYGGATGKDGVAGYGGAAGYGGSTGADWNGGYGGSGATGSHGGNLGDAGGSLADALNGIMKQMTDAANKMRSDVTALIEGAIQTAEQEVRSFMDGISARMNEIAKMNAEAGENWERCQEQGNEKLTNYGANLRSGISECGKIQFRKMETMAQKFKEKGDVAGDIANSYVTGVQECSKKDMLLGAMCIAQVKTTATMREGQLIAETSGMGAVAAAQMGQMKMEMGVCVAGHMAGMAAAGQQLISDTNQCFSGTNNTH